MKEIINKFMAKVEVSEFKSEINRVDNKVALI